MLRKAFPQIDVTTEHLVAEGSLVAYHYTISGAHEGQLMDFGPTGTDVEFSGISTGRTEDSQVVEGWTNVDVFGLMQQIGAIPEV